MMGICAPYFRTLQVTTSTTAAVLIPARNRVYPGLKIVNRDATISVYLGPKAGDGSGLGLTNGVVEAQDGFLLKAGESVDLPVSAEVWAIAASGTPVIAVTEYFSS